MTKPNPDADHIRWVECRLQERIDFDAGKLPNWVQLSCVLPRLSLEVWLAKKRDKKSWQQIVIQYLPDYLSKKAKMAGISQARRVFEAVERELNPKPSESLKQWLDGRIGELFHCTPEQFKKYLDGISARQTKKKS
jgi:hypothetical protein